MAIGTSLPRIDARAKVTGEAKYPGDLSMPGMAHAKVLFSRRPHARVLSIDTRAALAVPGVLAVYTGEDVPVNEYGLIFFDAPVLARPQTTDDGRQMTDDRRQTTVDWSSIVVRRPSTVSCATPARRWQWSWPRPRRSPRAPAI